MRRTVRPLAAAFGCLLVLAATGGAGPAVAAPSVHTGWATTFTQHWAPYGNCGVPTRELDTINYLALNLDDRSGGQGAYRGGRNCGRLVRVVIGRKCAGVPNGGGLNQGFCRGGRLVDDRYTGSTLTFVVADSCPDDNGWCRQDPAHLDLARAALARFTRHGKRVHGLGDATNWNNRQVHWSFVTAPAYHGGIRIGFQRDAQRYYPVVLLTHLRNGVSRVTYRSSGRWRTATTRGDEGQAFVLGGTSDGGTHYLIRIDDASGRRIDSGRTFAFTFPASCHSRCTAAYTAVRYTTQSS